MPDGRENANPGRENTDHSGNRMITDLKGAGEMLMNIHDGEVLVDQKEPEDRMPDPGCIIVEP